MSLKNKLNRLKPHLSLDGHNEKEVDTPKAIPIQIPFQERWAEENIIPYYLDEDYCLLREVKYPLSMRHGHYSFQDFLLAIEVWNRQGGSHPLSAKGYQAEELFFFDTETTGLGGGAGNTIFLLGYASVTGNQLTVRQHILPHPGAEIPLYHSFLNHVNYKTLVTYNGKSFDWPQVKTRHTLVREHVPKLPAFGHFDLFHAARRLWKHKLERLKLSIVEKEVLGVKRIDDIPGFLAPMIYFEFIESNQPEGMLGILKHNEIDILSLVTLYTHLTFQLNSIDRNQTRSEIYEVGRWYASIGEKAEAEKVLMKLTDRNDFTSYQAKLILAFEHKKNHEWEMARKLFTDVVDSSDNKMMLEACVELAKIFEHRLKDIPQALMYCEKAMKMLKRSHQQEMLKGITYDQLQTRWDRLSRKLVKFPG
ncbi:ribonuclease H-like domain-containing protein [Bacillus sp. BRMEA1]|uniref:ribonuclease H-like domain-containing protein n=1 Tax=Neobacillus endophyticus TaxID=2738405 RepID=UPI0015636631|nr:ribonuclease H-like domain-containing protein [Neobacillus endophyticus]NRD80528.1 ribonuclease H-like domain-containing protein [Neobacillus endophyticus]